VTALWLLGAPGVWAAYTWGAHLVSLGGIRRGRRSGRLAALTFDDGPDPVHTSRVLDILKGEGVMATFFLVGRRVAEAPEIARRMVTLGHDLGNHTWSHRSLWLCGPRRTEREIVRGHEAILEAAGTAPRFFRAPWGMANLAMFPVLRRLRTPCVSWTVQAEGRRPAAPEVQSHRVSARVKPGAILDLHDADGVPGAGDRLVRTLPTLIGTLRGAGYTLAPLRELLYTPATAPPPPS
jgi:peptidoglycan/xylan/chitin deacetylase (PgdA/CDA1 family)